MIISGVVFMDQTEGFKESVYVGPDFNQSSHIRSNRIQADSHLRRATRNLAFGSYITLSTLLGSLGFNVYTFLDKYLQPPERSLVKSAYIYVPKFNGGIGRVEVLEIEGKEKYYFTTEAGNISRLFHIKGYGTRDDTNKDISFLIGDLYDTVKVIDNCEFDLENKEFVNKDRASIK